MKLKLGDQVAAAVGGILAGRNSITLEEAQAALPAHLRAANPSIKAITKGIAAAGWIGRPFEGGRIVYMPPADDEGGDDPLHNGSDQGSIAADEVRLLIERRERLAEKAKGNREDVKDWAAEAKGRGYDVKSLNAVIKLRSKKKEERFEDAAILELYLRATGMME